MVIKLTVQAAIVVLLSVLYKCKQELFEEYQPLLCTDKFQVQSNFKLHSSVQVPPEKIQDPCVAILLHKFYT